MGDKHLPTQHGGIWSQLVKSPRKKTCYPGMSFGTLACQVQGTLCIALSVWTWALGLWVAMLGKYPGMQHLRINGQWEQRDLTGLAFIMHGGLWKHDVAHRCWLPCSNLFFNLAYSLIQPVKLPDFPHFSSRLIRGNLFLTSDSIPVHSLSHAVCPSWSASLLSY